MKNKRMREVSLLKKIVFTLNIFISVTIICSSCANENTEGARLYKTHCMNCHQEGGKGVGKLIPPIDKAFMLSNASKLGCIIKYGLNDTITVQGTEYAKKMPGNKKITDFDIVNILNYINQNFGNGESEKFNIEELRENLKECK